MTAQTIKFSTFVKRRFGGKLYSGAHNPNLRRERDTLLAQNERLRRVVDAAVAWSKSPYPDTERARLDFVLRGECARIEALLAQSSDTTALDRMRDEAVKRFVASDNLNEQLHRFLGPTARLAVRDALNAAVERRTNSTTSEAEATQRNEP